MARERSLASAPMVVSSPDPERATEGRDDLRPSGESQQQESCDKKMVWGSPHTDRMAPPARLERATTGSEVQRSIQLSYGGPGRATGFEPATS